MKVHLVHQLLNLWQTNGDALGWLAHQDIAGGPNWVEAYLMELHARVDVCQRMWILQTWSSHAQIGETKNIEDDIKLLLVWHATCLVGFICLLWCTFLCLSLISLIYVLSFNPLFLEPPPSTTTHWYFAFAFCVLTYLLSLFLPHTVFMNMPLLLVQR